MSCILYCTYMQMIGGEEEQFGSVSQFTVLVANALV